MKDLYEYVGITKQAVHKARIRGYQREVHALEFFKKADKIRKHHPGKGCRKIARDLVCKGWGRDKVEDLLMTNGYRVCYPRRFARTTDHRKEFYYPNLIEGLEVNNINQVIQTDITYYRVKEKFFYIVFLIDVYSRRIVGYSLSKSLHAEANIKALKQVLELRTNDDLNGLIHHSDRGSQFVHAGYRKCLAENRITPSMCKNGWENAYTERINRTIKEEYLDYWNIKDYAHLARMLKKAVYNYNHKRGHDSLKNITPVAFEKIVKNLDESNRSKMKIYKYIDDYPQKSCE
jgi:putative transposase